MSFDFGVYFVSFSQSLVVITKLREKLSLSANGKLLGHLHVMG